MFIKPVEYGSKIYSQIYEDEDEFLSPFKPLDIIKKSCEYFGVDYESRRKGTKLLIGYSRKLPIIIEPTSNIFFIPTISPDDPRCIWFSHEHVKDYYRVATQQTMVIFRNNQSYIFPVSYSTFNTQILRTSYLKTKLMQRIEFNKKKLFLLMHGPNTFKASESSEFYLKDPK
jgi:competence protein ComK